MSKQILSVFGEKTTEQVIEKSKFITSSCHVESEEDAKNFISKIKEKHPQATHNCYAYIADKLGNLQRFSDDGEPSGTAGVPMLEVLKNKNLFETCVVVTRYFGGIKLGAGGLVRAYSSSVSQNLDNAELRNYQICKELHLFVTYDLITPMQNFLEKNDCTIIDTLYNDNVCFCVSVIEENKDEFISKLNDFLNGKLEVKEKDSYYFPFMVKQ